MMTTLEKFLLKALAEYGTYEFSGAKHNSRILEYHATTTLKATTDEIAWCSSFVNWVVQGCGLVPTESAAARSWMYWGKATEKPVFGCIVVLDRRSKDNPNAAHVGFFIRELGVNIFVLGGNQGNSVSIYVYPKSRVLGYRVPENYV
jgi:uncharacterized protein (TIGR02594 family)